MNINLKNRKIRKLFRDPKLYFKDFYLKRIHQLKKQLKLKRKKNGFSSYTIVSACYNAAPYLDDFFKSIISQELDFKNNIQCIIVDDGSTDNSKEKILQWQKKYPENIKYIYQENCGQALARNNGLKFVDTEWVTFIDPDDFINAEFFSAIDNYLAVENSSICMVATNILMYMEKNKSILDNHALKFKFNKTKTVKINNLKQHIQLSASSALFKVEHIRSSGLQFDERIKPNFEDAHFVTKYISENSDKSVAFLKESIYYYRKRESSNSTIDLSWLDKRKYSNVIRYGMLDLFNKYGNSEYIQNVVLYDLLWHVKYILNRPERLDFLNDEEKANYVNLLKKCFEKIDVKTIMCFNVSGCWFYYKVGLLHCFKNKSIDCEQIVYVENFDPYKKQLKLRYFDSCIGLEEFKVDNNDTLPSVTKTVQDDFLGSTFVKQRIIWLPISNLNNSLQIILSNKIAKISLGGKFYKTLPYPVLKSYTDKFKKYASDSPWIFMDREIQADDNAEHLYRYCIGKVPNIYFVLKRDSHDWARLQDEGFKLLEYGSLEHERLLKSCSKIISSHLDGYIVNYFKNGSTDDKQIIFLQHGPTIHDLSRWLNGKKRIDLMVTETEDEFKSIAYDQNRYRLTQKEVRLLGFPRHDALLPLAESKKEIVIMPTWRQYLMGEQISGNIRKLNSDFINSDYAIHWQSLLHSKKLKTLSEKYHYKILFYPHSNIQPYLSEFNIPSYIVIKHHFDGSIQNVFKSARVMITDYSSVAMEMAYLKKAICYYQFDRDEFFAGKHTIQLGYFDYFKDGLGPVSINEEELLNNLEDILNNNGKPSKKYISRINSTFKFYDGKNCERVLEAIRNLDSQELQSCEQTTIDYISKAYENQKWSLALDRIKKSNLTERYSNFVDVCKFMISLENGDMQTCQKLIKKNLNIFTGYPLYRYYTLTCDYESALLQLKSDRDSIWKILYCLILQDKDEELEKILQTYNFQDDEFVNDYVRMVVGKRYHDAIDLAMKKGITYHSDMHYCILNCFLSREIKRWPFESYYREKIKVNYGKCIEWRLLSARRSLEDERSDASKDIYIHVITAFKSFKNIPICYFNMFAKACYEYAPEKIIEMWKELNQEGFDQQLEMLSKYYLKLLIRNESWSEIIDTVDKFHRFVEFNDLVYKSVALRMLSKYNHALSEARKLEFDSSLYYYNRALLEEYFDNYDAAIEMWKKYILLNPSEMLSFNSRLINLNVSKVR